MKKFKILSQNRHEYDVVIEDTDSYTLYSLYRSDSLLWTFPGELIISIEDNGSDIELSQELGKKLDYSTLVELKILLNIIANEEKNLSTPFEAIEVPENPIFV
jgi:hypothetical protein